MHVELLSMGDAILLFSSGVFSPFWSFLGCTTRRKQGKEISNWFRFSWVAMGMEEEEEKSFVIAGKGEKEDKPRDQIN